tara:strand:- start:493 stop:1458 length:966 start_codon:yes stop_codon:yes gene_type:complete
MILIICLYKNTIHNTEILNNKITFLINALWKKKMLIAQISDMHIVDEGELCNELVPTNDMLVDAIERINEIQPKVDIILASGDLTQNGSKSEYRNLKSILSNTNIPVYMIPGNHDKPNNFKDVFQDNTYIPEEGSLSYVINDFPVTIIGIDTTIENSPCGEISERILSWVENKLTEYRNKPVIIFMHHPPFKTGIWWMDAIGLKGKKKFEQTIKKFKNIEAVLCGHIHRQVQRRWAGTIGYIAPSTAHQLVLDLEGNYFLGCSYDPPAFSLHKWDQSHSLVSHVCYVKKSENFVPPEYSNKIAINKAYNYFKKQYETIDSE